MKKVLVIIAESRERTNVVCHLEQDGFFVFSSSSPAEGLEIIGREWPDLAILDLGLPSESVLSLLGRIHDHSDMPIIILAPRQTEIDCVRMLEAGADDYLRKPYSLHELSSRLRAILRRVELGRMRTDDSPLLKVGDLRIDLWGREVRLDGHLIDLSAKEFDLLRLLALRAGQVVSRETLLAQIWGPDFKGGERTLDVHIRWLREKIESDPGHPCHIETIYGEGYKLSRCGA